MVRVCKQKAAAQINNISKKSVTPHKPLINLNLFQYYPFSARTVTLPNLWL